MMKHLLLLLILFILPVMSPAASLSVGDQVPDISFELMESGENLHLSSLEGKVVVIEFWASWCSPCITGMRHLQDLKERFGEKLVVLAVSREEPDRIRRFTANTSFDFNYVGHSDELDELFPHRVIPHTVILRPDRHVAAITAPGNLDEEAFERLIGGEVIDLPVKNDRPWDASIDIFELDSTAEEAFQIQPARPEAPTYSRIYREGPFQDRRRSFVNFSIPILYRSAFNTTVYRMEYPEEGYDERYCVDILVPASGKEQLDKRLQDSLNAYFNWRVEWKPKEVEVWVLTSAPEGIRLPFSDIKQPYTARGDRFSSSGTTMADFASYLEGFGLAGKPVIDETGSRELYRIDFSFQPEDSASFYEAVADMGLAVKKEVRTIEVLVLSPPEE